MRPIDLCACVFKIMQLTFFFSGNMQLFVIQSGYAVIASGKRALRKGAGWRFEHNLKVTYTAILRSENVR